MKENSRIDEVNQFLKKDRINANLESDTQMDDNSSIEELENELKRKNNKIIELQKKFEDAQERIHEVIIQKNSFEKRVNELELKQLSLQLVNYDELKNKFSKLEHRMQITKKQLDDTRNHIELQKQRIKLLEKVIEDLENRGLTDYLRHKFPETFIEYKKK